MVEICQSEVIKFQRLRLIDLEPKHMHLRSWENRTMHRVQQELPQPCATGTPRKKLPI